MARSPLWTWRLFAANLLSWDELLYGVRMCRANVVLKDNHHLNSLMP